MYRCPNKVMRDEIEDLERYTEDYIEDARASLAMSKKELGRKSGVRDWPEVFSRIGDALYDLEQAEDCLKDLDRAQGPTGETEP